MPDFFDLKLPAVMGVININEQSFYSHSVAHGLSQVLIKIETMLDDGAGIIDIGAQSTNPNASPLDQDEEWQLLKNIIPELSRRFPETIFSIDTFFPSIAHRALDYGFRMINDVSAARFDENMLSTIAPYNPFFVCMHWTNLDAHADALRKLVNTHEQPKPYKNIMQPKKVKIIAEIQQFFRNNLTRIQDLGIRKILLDPGLGFGKTVEQNFEILRNMSEFSTFGYPLLIALSRKSFICKSLNITPEQALNGSMAMNMCALLNGASVLRTHDVFYSMELLKLYRYLQGVTYS